MRFVLKVTVILLLFLVSSCSFPGSYYIKNLSGKERNIVLIKTPVNSNTKFEFRFTKKNLKNIKYSSFEKMSNSIAALSENNMLSFAIPPESILYLGEESLLRQMFDKIIIDGDTLDVYKVKYRNGTHVSKQFPGKFAAWIDIN